MIQSVSYWLTLETYTIERPISSNVMINRRDSIANRWSVPSA